MPLITAQFLLDRVDLQHQKDKEGYTLAYTKSAARELGELIVNQFPFVVTEYPNNIPEVAFTRDHEFKDLHKLELFVMTREQHQQLVEALQVIKLVYGGRNAKEQFDIAKSILNQ